MARLPSPRAKARPRLEIIPFIDIMFFLLATFMMVSLNLIRNQGIPVHLPKAASAAPQERRDPVSLTVAADGGLFWNQEPIASEALPGRLAALKQSQPDPRVFINGDEKAGFGQAVAVLDAVRVAGIAKVAIETRKGAEARNGPEAR